MPDLADVLALKKKVATLRSRKDRAAGALEKHMFDLLDEFGVCSLEEAEKLVEAFLKEEQAAEKAFTKGMDAFEKKWGEKLDV